MSNAKVRHRRRYRELRRIARGLEMSVPQYRRYELLYFLMEGRPLRWVVEPAFRRQP